MPKPQLTPAAIAERRAASGRALMPGEFDGAALRDKRQRAGVGLTQFAVKVGLSESALRNIELGNKQPSVEARYRIVNELGCEPDELLAKAA